jgi:hypothetical protein
VSQSGKELFMQRTIHTLLFLTLILGACTTSVASPPAVPPSTTEAPLAIPTTAVPSYPQQCGYQWAQKDLPELSSSFQQSIQMLQPEAQASAYAFGEDCLQSDGSVAGFSAMETDFNVTLQVTDLANESDLGEWIVKVMQVIKSIPQEQIVGPRPGRVSIRFQSEGDQKFTNFYIDQYQTLPSGLSNAEIFQALQTPQ